MGIRTFYLIAALLLAGCSDYTDVDEGGTFIVAVSGEQFRVRINNVALARRARRMLTGAEEQKIVVGQLDRGDGGFNAPYHWHMKPATISFADLTIELCDGRPSDVEGDIAYWVDTVKQYCPWGGAFVAEVGN